MWDEDEEIACLQCGSTNVEPYAEWDDDGVVEIEYDECLDCGWQWCHDGSRFIPSDPATQHQTARDAGRRG